MTASLAAAKQISMDVGAAAVLSELDGIFPLNQFLHGQLVFTLLSTGFGKSLVLHSGALWLATGW